MTEKSALEIAEKVKDEKKIVEDAPLYERTVGIWTLLTEPPSFRFTLLHDIQTSLVSLRRLVWDIWTLGPELLIVYFFSKGWDSIEPVLLLQFSSRLLQLIEIGIREGKPDAMEIGKALLARLLCMIIASLVSYKKERLAPKLENRVDLFYQEYLLSANLKIDLPTSKDGSSRNNASAHSGWRAFENLIDYISLLVSTLAQLGFMLQASQNHGPLFALLCMTQPLLRTLSSSYLWMKPHIVYANNDAYKRMQSLQAMSSPDYRREIIGGDLAEYIVSQYSKARKLLQETTSEESSDDVYWPTPNPYLDMLVKTAGDLPMVYYAATAVLYPAHFSLTSIALLQQSSMLMQQTISSIVWQTESVTRSLTDLRKLHNVKNISNHVVDGGIAFPNIVDTCGSSSKGMGFELKDVTFNYPASKTTTSAIVELNLTVSPGELIVIVGGNGSGKSTLVNLLTRLYDATSGQISVDSRPIKDYAISDLRRATALLSQDHSLFPLSIYENVALGSPDHFDDIEIVNGSVEKGGAKFIDKFEQGLQTVLEPVQTAYGCNIHDEDDPVRVTLRKKLAEVEKAGDVSGGERQRIVAARTFMRFNSGKIRFVAVDEPSSALDAEGEVQLFDNLIQARQGKTMIFVTHRFGHLTKFADRILFMKEGKIVENGTHEVLMKLDGEYAKFYNVQASAFSNAKE